MTATIVPVTVADVVTELLIDREAETVEDAVGLPREPEGERDALGDGLCVSELLADRLSDGDPLTVIDTEREPHCVALVDGDALPDLVTVIVAELETVVVIETLVVPVAQTVTLAHDDCVNERVAEPDTEAVCDAVIVNVPDDDSVPDGESEVDSVADDE